MLHIPAIHKFPEVRSWGFHPLTQLLEAANNRFLLQGKPGLTLKEFMINFFSVSQDLSPAPLTRHQPAILTVLEGVDGKGTNLLIVESDLNSLEDYVLEGLFVPSGWGVEVLKAIDSGAYSSGIVRGGGYFLVVVYFDYNGNQIKR